MTKSILYVDPFAGKSNKNLRYYHGFYEALKVQYAVTLCNDLNNLPINNSYDAIIFGLAVSKQGYIDRFYNKNYPQLKNFEGPKICFVLCLKHLDEKVAWMKQHKITHVFSEYYQIKSLLANNPFIVNRLLFATEDRELTVQQNNYKYDVGFIGALHTPYHDGNKYDLRTRIGKFLNDNMNKYKVLFMSNKRVSIEEYYRLMGETKIWLSTTSIPDGTIAPRYYDAALGKTLILCDEWETTYEGIFTDKVNCIMFKKDLSNFDTLLDYYVNHDDERLQIIEQAYGDVKRNHLWSNRVTEMMTIVFSSIK